MCKTAKYEHKPTMFAGEETCTTKSLHSVFKKSTKLIEQANCMQQKKDLSVTVCCDCQPSGIEILKMTPRNFCFLMDHQSVSAGRCPIYLMFVFVPSSRSHEWKQHKVG